MEERTVTLNKSFEARTWVKNWGKIRNKIKALGGQLKPKSVFTDYIFKPRHQDWNLDEKNLKLRVWEEGDNKGLVEIKYFPADWQKGVKAERAAFNCVLYSKKEAFEILREWDFEKLFGFSRKREVYEVKDLLVFLEDIEHLGKMIEVEGDRLVEVEKMLNELGFKERVSHSVPYLVWKSLKTKKNEAN